MSRDERAAVSVARVRIGLITAMGAVVALAAGDVFDQWRWELLVVPSLVGPAAIATVRRRWTWRLAAAALAVVGSVGVVVAVDGGGLADARAAFGEGLQRVLSTEWPSPARPDLVATLAAALAALLASASELARHERLHLSPLVPVLLAHGGVIALSAPTGPRMVWLVPLGLLAAAFALVRPGVSVRDRWAVLLGERRLATMALGSLAVAVAVAVPVAMTDRADPRRNDEAVRSASLLDPIEATLALRAIEPPADLYRIDLVDGSDEVPRRWRTVAVDAYDGRRWGAGLTIRPIGRRLATGTEVDAVGTITFLDDSLQLVPLPGRPVTVDALIESDSDRTLVRLTERPMRRTTVPFSASVAPSVGEVGDDGVGVREVDETASGLSQVAETIMVNASPDGVPPDDLLDRLALIEATMRDEFALDDDAPGGGLQRTLIERFVRDTRRGNAEQFSTAFVLLARSLGVDARVAVGYEVPPASIERDGTTTTLVLTSADATIWPEVRIGDEWVAFDPTPDQETSDVVPEPEELRSQSPVAPQPPAEPPPEATDDPEVTDEDRDEVAGGALAAVVRVGIVAMALIVPIVIVAAAILALKWSHRRRTLSGAGLSHVRGAWRVATDRLVDAGMEIGSAATNGDIARRGAPYVPSAETALHHLGSLASAATFGQPDRADALAADATTQLGVVEGSMTAARTRWQRMRWRLSVRSLRRATRSPV